MGEAERGRVPERRSRQLTRVSAIAKLAGRLDLVVELFGRLAAWIGVALVLLVAGNVLVRYFLHTGAIWLQELEWHLIAPIALFGMSYALLHGEALRVDGLYQRFPERVRLAIDIASGLAMALIAALLVKLSIPFVLQSYAMGEGSPNPDGIPHRFLLKALIPLGFAVLFVQATAEALRAILKLFPSR